MIDMPDGFFRAFLIYKRFITDDCILESQCFTGSYLGLVDCIRMARAERVLTENNHGNDWLLRQTDLRAESEIMLAA